MSTTGSIPSPPVKPIRPIGVLDLFIVITVIGLTLGLSGYFERLNIGNSEPADLDWKLRWLARANAFIYLAVPASLLFCLLIRWRRDGWPGWKPGHGLLMYLGSLAILEVAASLILVRFLPRPMSTDFIFLVGIFYSVQLAVAMALAPLAFRSMKGHRRYWTWLVVSLVAAVVLEDLAEAFQFWGFWLRYVGPAFVAMIFSIAIIVSRFAFVIAWLIAVVMGVRNREGLGWLHWWGVASAFCSIIVVWGVEYLTTLYFMNFAP